MSFLLIGKVKENGLLFAAHLYCVWQKSYFIRILNFSNSANLLELFCGIAFVPYLKIQSQGVVHNGIQRLISVVYLFDVVWC